MFAPIWAALCLHAKRDCCAKWKDEMLSTSFNCYCYFYFQFYFCFSIYGWHLISQVWSWGKGVKITKFHLKTKTIFTAQAELRTTTQNVLLVPIFLYLARRHVYVLSVLQHNGILCALHTNSETIYYTSSMYENASAAELESEKHARAAKQTATAEIETHLAIKAGRWKIS